VSALLQSPRLPARRGAGVRGGITPAATPRALVLVALAAAVACGLLAVRSPVAAVAAALALAATALVLHDLAAGIAVFTLTSFAAVLQVGSSASAAKGMGALLLVGWLALRIRRAAGRAPRSLAARHPAIAGGALALVAWNALSVAWAQSPAAALSGTERYAEDMLLLPIMFAGLVGVRRLRWVIGAFAVGALLAFAYGWVTGATFDLTRVSGAGGDPNETAAMLVAAIPLALVMAGTSESSRGRVVWALVTAGCTIGLVETGSRGGFVALAASIAAGVLLAGRWRGRAAVAAALAIALAAGWFLLLAPSATRQHVTSSSTTGRSMLWTVAIRAIRAHPVAGLGNDNFQQASKYYLVRPGATTAAYLIVDSPHVAHDLYLEAWADTGVVGLLLFVGLIAAGGRCALLAVREADRAGRAAEALLGRGLAVAIIGILAAGFFLSDIYSKQLWLLVALGPPLLAATRERAAAVPGKPDARAAILHPSLCEQKRAWWVTSSSSPGS
jgi:O-antigen ligase